MKQAHIEEIEVEGETQGDASAYIALPPRRLSKSERKIKASKAPQQMLCSGCAALSAVTALSLTACVRHHCRRRIVKSGRIKMRWKNRTEKLTTRQSMKRQVRTGQDRAGQERRGAKRWLRNLNRAAFTQRRNRGCAAGTHHSLTRSPH